MKALNCDICGNFFIPIPTICNVTDNTRPNYIVLSHRAANGNTSDYLRADICPECADAIVNTVKGLAYGKRCATNPFEDDLK